LVDSSQPKRGRGRPKKDATMKDALSFRIPPELKAWLDEEARKSALDVGTTARLKLMEAMYASKSAR